MSRRAPSAVFFVALFFFRLLRGSLLVFGAALVAVLLALLGSRVVRKRSSISGDRGRAEIGGRPEASVLNKSYDPNLVVDARYEEIE